MTQQDAGVAGDLPTQERWLGTLPRDWGRAQRVGLVLSGGGLKFAVHAGLYGYMEGLPYCCDGLNQNGPALSEAFDCVVGTSAGSLLASAIASGFCAEDVNIFADLFSQPGFQGYVLDPNWLGLGSFLLAGDLGYIKGLYRGEAIQRTLSVFFSHNFLSGLGELYSQFARQNRSVEGAEFKKAIADLLRSLLKLPLEKLPQMAGEITDRLHPFPATSGPALRLITFQDLNPAVRIPYERYYQDKRPDWHEQAWAYAQQRLVAQQEHAASYRQALATYYQGRALAGRYIPLEPEQARPILLVVGTDLVTGQKTIFSNYNLFEKELVYSKDFTTSRRPGITYRYIDQAGRLAYLPAELSEQLRPANYLYKQLYDGLPLAWAIRASISIPGVFAPAVFRYVDDYGVTRTDFFIDGGVTDNYALQVAADWNIGRCERILGGNIGNLGPRVHDYGVRSIIEILLRTLLTQGDTNVDANADDRLLQRSAVTTINELTPTDVTSLRELVRIPELLKQGRELAEQFFASFRTPSQPGRPVALDDLFGEAGSYLIFLPRIETFGDPPGTPAPPLPSAPPGCTEMPTGSSEIDRIANKATFDDAAKTEVKKERSVQLGQCESKLIPPTLRGPGGLLPQPSGAKFETLPFGDPVNWARRGILAVLLTFVGLLALGVWRLTLLAGWFGSAAARFDGWGYGWLLIAVLVTAFWLYAIFGRAVVYDFWVGRPAKLLRRGLEIPIGLALYWLPLVLNEQWEGLAVPWPGLLSLLLIPFSTGALFFALYALIAFFLTLTKVVSVPRPTAG